MRLLFYMLLAIPLCILSSFGGPGAGEVVD